MASTLIREGKAAMWTDFAFDYDFHAQRTELGLAPFPEDATPANPRSMYDSPEKRGTTSQLHANVIQ
jgi:hypothetical protein